MTVVHGVLNNYFNYGNYRSVIRIFVSKILPFSCAMIGEAAVCRGVLRCHTECTAQGTVFTV